VKILYVEDDPEAQAFVSRALRESGFVVDTAGDGDTGFGLASAGAYDVLILDVKLPGMSGFELLRRLRRGGSTVPVLFLTAQGEVGSRIEGLELGADDYLAKPFALAELLARIRAVARRQQRQAKEGVVRVGDLLVDTERHHVERGGRRIQLTPKEFQLLEYLGLNAGYVVSRSMIAEKIWGHGFESYSNAIDVHVNNLRKKIDRAGAGKLIHTVKGLGYVLEERPDEGGDVL
jgi:two-component system, OmpR family, copper resistance phosphate regulon response regulator CusR